MLESFSGTYCFIISLITSTGMLGTICCIRPYSTSRDGIGSPSRKLSFNMEMIQCIKEMKAGGAPVIAVTRYYPSEVAQLADHVLYVAANESLFRNGAMSSRLSQLNVMDILYTAYASRNHEDTMRRLTKTHIYKPGDPEVLTQP